MANTYDRGNLVRLTATFSDATGAAADPTAVVLRLKDPTGTLTTPPPTRSALGVYYYDLSLAVIGAWFYRWESTGAVQTAAESLLLVRTSQF